MPFDSMNIGITGMDASQTQIDVISNNIANVGTTGFKGQNVSFQDLLYQIQQAGSGPTKTSGGVNYQQLGIGAKVGSTDTDPTQGSVQATGVTTNMMIDGNGYFIMNNADGTGAPTYTRDGDFSLNANGLLVDPSSGQGVMGYTANAAGVLAAGTPGPIQIPIGLATTGTATGAGAKQGPVGDKVFDMSLAGNLDSTQFSAAVSNGGASAANLFTVGTTIYDSLGNPHLVNITFQPTDTAPLLPAKVISTSGAAVTGATAWEYTVSSTDGTQFDGATTSKPQFVLFAQNGQFINTSGGGNVGLPAFVHLAGAVPSEQAGDQLNVTKWGTPANTDNAVTGTKPATPGPIAIDMSSMTSNATASSVVSTGQNGYPPGTLTGISVGQDGTISGLFTNGQSKTLAQVALATFQNEQGLLLAGGNQYQQSVNSGAAQVGSADTGSFGSITGGALELSNVSIGDQFTKLIVAQNAFTANSKSITTGDEVLQTAIALNH